MRNLLFAACPAFLLIGGAAASAHTKIYTTTMSGPNEFPANASPGVGSSTVTIDTDSLTMRVQAEFSGLLGTVTAAHIHGPIPDPPANPLASVATTSPSFTGFPTGVTAGTYDHTYDLTQTSSYHPNFVSANGGTAAGAMNAFIAGMDAGKMYFNIHSSQFGGGEIRGFMQLVPEPSAFMLGGLGAAGLLARRRRTT